ncbi:hypothetical protein OJF2_74610 [Aquisphaera giovannonii]|uniref:NHL repeat protein n=1 Tax=Aquisphaera giovannonii TaxID=406548 RepID=A0A5B9WFT4_9BACT|nr:hypothetical protein [Aquisphaera giovannonii]QEH38851.1 hypothetical protein OJF2_74610 [Aquisphaera giovannonii]
MRRRPRLAATMPAVLLPLLAGHSAARAEDARRLDAKVSWIGNTYPGGKRWVPQDVRAICVLADGTAYTNVPWDEGGGQVAVIKDGQVLGHAGHTHGWGQEGGEAIAANGNYVFIGQSMGNEGGGLEDPGTWPPKGKAWFGISRRLRSDVTKPAPFPGGKGGKGDTLRECFLPVVEVDDREKADLPGLVADDRRVYASSPRDGRIEVLDAETMKTVARWPIDRPGPIALDASGGLWVLQAGEGPEPARVVRLSPDGDPSPQRVELTAGSAPTSLAIDGRGRLLVADDGPDQHILIYEDILRSPRAAGTFGARGGIYAGTPGAVGPLKLNRPAAVGADAAGNILIASDGQTGGGGTVLESYRPDGSLNCRLLGVEFVDMADFDPASDADIFTKEEHFVADFSRPRGQEAGYVGYTVHRFKYPEDPRLHIWSAGAWVRRIAGRRFLFVNEMNAGPLQVYRFDPEQEGEIAVPSGLFAPRRLTSEKDDAWPPHQPTEGGWVWCDANGDGRFDASEYKGTGRDEPDAQGWWVDSVGNVWRATEADGIREFRFDGLDAKGNPVWDFAAIRSFPKPPEFDRVKRLRYDAAADVMYLGGTTREHANQHWKPMGPVICRYDHWSRGPSRPTWRIVAPYARGSQGHESCEPMGFDVAGEYLFLPYTGSSKPLGFRTGHVEVFRAGDGRRVGYLEPSEDVGEIGLQDIRECLVARRRADGEYVILMEEDYKAKILMYRWRP